MSVIRGIKLKDFFYFHEKVFFKVTYLDCKDWIWQTW